MAAQFAHGGAVPVRVARRRARWRRPRVPMRLQVMIHRIELDRQLAGGADPASSELLTIRGAQLTSERNRTRLADGLEPLIAPHSGPVGLSSVVRPRADLRRSRAVLLALQRRLRSGEELQPGGIAVLKWLISDSAGPLYADPDPDAIASVLRLAAATMTVRGQP